MAGRQQHHSVRTSPTTAKLQILVLHGSRQDGEVFSQRLKTLSKKLKNIADLHFVSSPHTLPLQEGQSVPMRAWWRHWNMEYAEDEDPTTAPQQQQQDMQQEQHQASSSSSSTTTTSASLKHANSASPFAHQQQDNGDDDDEQLPAPLVQQLQHQPSLLHGEARQEEISSMMAAGWEAVVLRDWAGSLQHLTHVWTSAAQEFDGVLGFSNGAAAAFLFAAHAAAHPETFGSLRFVALAGGYVPEPLDKLLHPSLLLDAPPTASSAAATTNSSAAVAAPVTRLKSPLPFASLHMMGSNDPLIDLEVSSQLMQCFQEQGRVQLVHDSGHCVPQQARFMEHILKFIVSFADIPLVVPAAAAKPHQHHHGRSKQPGHAGAAAAGGGGGMEAAVADIDAKLHRQGLREKVSKGPAKKHLLIRVDSSGQPHQHLLSPKGSSSGTSHITHRHSQQRDTLQAAAVSALQQQQQGAAGVAAAVASTAAPVGTATVASRAVAGPQLEFGEATELQLEELEALEAIFGSEYSLVSSCPPTCVVRLREPDDSAACAGGGAGGSELSEGQPPSALFSLRFKLPKEYPACSPSAQLLIDIEGPLGAHDPIRTTLHAHLMATAAEQQAELAGSGGYIWQLVGAAKDWIDGNVPADIATRKAGQAAVGGSNHGAMAGVDQLLPGQQGVGLAAAAAAAAAAAGNSGSGGSSIPWWESEDVDLQLVAKATAEAAAAHWASWSVSQEDNPWGNDADEAGAAAAAGGAGTTASTSTSSGSAEALAAAGDGVRGRWDYVVALVGKPSSGKSTTLNAITDPATEEEAAREGAFPFTTIQPNVARGFIALPDPSPLLGFSPDQVQPAYGFAPGLDISRVQQAGYSNIGPLLQLVKDCGWQQQQQPTGGDGVLWRRVPVVIKDVAGLVPGAYQGRGRGNAFLSDLCDADVLIHVVDASGTTDSKGQAMTAAAAGAGAGAGAGATGGQQLEQDQPEANRDAGGEDPVEEVSWVRRELHCWVYDNVRAKWPGVLRRPSRLPGLFSGYHAPVGLVHAVLRAVGVKLDELTAETAAMGNAGLLGGSKESGQPVGSSSLASWGEWELHRLVAHFLAARFPIMLALNKADLPSAPDNIRAVLAAYPHQAAVAISAAAERKLHTLRRGGLVQYEDAASCVQLIASADTQAAASQQAAAAVHSIQQSVLGVYGTTGVLAALTCALALKPPRWVFPIGDRERCTALAAAPTSRAGGGGGGGGGSSSSNKGSKHGGAAAASLGWGVDAKARAALGAGVLRDCVLVKPGSRVEDVFWVLKRPPYALLEGDFVRAECRVLGQGASPLSQHAAKMRVVRKDELVGPSNAVLLLQTNRKVSWQRQKETQS